MAGNFLCIEGHIGALCETCDIYGVFWDKNWVTSSAFKCGKCEEVKNNIIILVLVSVYTFGALGFSVLGFIEDNEN